MKHKNSHLLIGYWNRLRRGRAVPDQTDIDPRAVKRMLSQMFILEASSVARPVYRLAGTAICERFGHELRSINFLSHWESQSGLALASLLRQSLRLRQPLCLASIGVTQDAGMVEIETVLVPVSFGGSEPTRVIGMMQILGDVTHLYGRTLSYERLVGSQFIREDEPLAAFDDLPPAPPMVASLREHPKAPYLRLVVSRRGAPTVHFEGEAILKDVFDALADIGGDSKLVS